MWEHLRPGERLADRYDVEQVLGWGRTGVVVAASHHRQGRRVAIKLLRDADCSGACARLSVEARAVARLQNPHIAMIHDIDDLPDGTPYIVMEYLEGRTLAEELAQRGAIPAGEAVRWVRQACSGLGEAHRQGIVHYDVKPANLFLVEARGEEPRLKVLDFGVSNALHADVWQGVAQSCEGTFVVAPGYLAPEQIESSRDVDARVDVWAIGAVLYEMLTGSPPFPATHLEQLRHRILHEEPVPLELLLPCGTESLVEVVARCLAKQPEARFASMDALIDALPDEGALGGIPACTIDPSEVEVAPADTLRPMTAAERSGSTGVARWVVSIVAGVGLVGGLLFLGIRGDAMRSASAPAPPDVPEAQVVSACTDAVPETRVVPARLGAASETLAAAGSAVPAASSAVQPTVPRAALATSSSGRAGSGAPGILAVGE